MNLRRPALLVLALTTVALAGCTPDPQPSPTPTPAFASEEEAFAAAEETFDRYNDALNNIDLQDPESFDALFELSSGSVEKSDRENFSSMHAEGWTISGDSRVTRFKGVRSDPPHVEVVAAVCLDVSDVVITDVSGNSTVDPERPDVYPLMVTMKISGGGKLLVDSAARMEEHQCSA
ncbi:hypothetical protein AB3M89_14505 [Microbacterium sp. 179-I 3D2 NHS]|uniref:hypothetical protein n=1 Tax=Microbacterium sp. 179-I 3D2 NHS TaxID=3235178 RepID=UPI00399FA327